MHDMVGTILLHYLTMEVYNVETYLLYEPLSERMYPLDFVSLLNYIHCILVVVLFVSLAKAT